VTLLLVASGLRSTERSTKSSESVAVPYAGVEADDPCLEHLSRWLRMLADRHKETLDQQFDAIVQRSIWDMTYDNFRDACMGTLRHTINSVSNWWEQISSIYAGHLHIKSELQHAGGDVSRQNLFAGFLARFLNNHKFGAWIQDQGGWVRRS